MSGHKGMKLHERVMVLNRFKLLRDKVLRASAHLLWRLDANLPRLMQIPNPIPQLYPLLPPPFTLFSSTKGISKVK